MQINLIGNQHNQQQAHKLVRKTKYVVRIPKNMAIIQKTRTF